MEAAVKAAENPLTGPLAKKNLVDQLGIDELLALEFKDLQLGDFDLGLTGFDGDEIDQLLADAVDGMDGLDDADGWILRTPSAQRIRDRHGQAFPVSARGLIPGHSIRAATCWITGNL